MTETHTSLRQYYLAQSLFWGGYILLNLVFLGLSGQASPLAMVIFLMLSIFLMISSHGLRCLYRRFATNWTLLKTALNLAWLLPVVSLLVQYLLYIFITAGVRLFSVNTEGMSRSSIGAFLGYAMNVCIMLILWSTFYLLRVELRKRRNAEIAQLQLQLALKDSELQFLRGQINSHFLFNALNNLRSLIREDAERARTGLNDLASLLRGLLHVDPAKKVKLKDELEWVKGYLALEALQFEARLQTEFSIDESLLNQELPPLILQTLVENAIRHGVAARRDGGVVHISASKVDPQRWRLCVTNPSPTAAMTKPGNGIGLKNARQRLQLAYGDQAKLSLEFGEPVTAIVELPL